MDIGKAIKKSKKSSAQAIEMEPINIYAEDPKKEYLNKIRKMGILRQDSEMPKRLAKGQIEESIKKSGRNSFEPVSSKKTLELYRKSKELKTPEKELEGLFEGVPVDQMQEQEDAIKKEFEKKDSGIPEERKKEYLKLLQKRMRTA
jgi:hypothetical protein